MQSKRNLIPLLCFLTLLAAGPMSAQEARFAWQKDYAKVLPNGDLEWAPEPYAYEPKGELRYIDYENGSDANPGTKDAPWKHHPWDPAAGGKARTGSADTYVFKGGVTYRGGLLVPANASAKLLRDPSWGEGEARFYGSQVVKGWRRQAHRDMPDGEKVWAADVAFLPRNAWLVGKDGKISRLKLARTPNWEVSDPNNINSEWWEWENPGWWERYTKNKDPMVMQVDGRKMHKGISRKLATVGDNVEGAVVWTESGIPTMDIPMPMRIKKFVAAENAIPLGTPWYDGYSAMVMFKAGHRFYLEDKAAFLDEAGEFWVEKTGRNSGTMYARFPGDQAPENFVVEAARHSQLIEAPKVKDLTISGLTFRFTNVPWNYAVPHFMSPDLPSAVVRVQGYADNLSVTYNRFEHVSMPLYAYAIDLRGFGTIAFNDNDVTHTDQGVAKIDDESGTTAARKPERREEMEKHRGIHSVEALRNRMYDTGFRTSRARYQYGIEIGPADLTHVAGNIGYRMGRQGIDVFGAKRSGDPRYAPFTRILIHQNKMVDTMLQASDFAAIENWQGGPAYVFNNLAGNPGGVMNPSVAKAAQEKKGTPRFAFCYYTDGAQKVYHFNNIAYGENNEPGSIYANSGGFQSLIGFQNSKVNNTVYKFINGIRRQGTGGSRMQKYLGNLFEDISEHVFLHHTGKADPNFSHFNNAEGYDFRLMAYANNVFTTPGLGLGIIDESGKVYSKIEPMAKRLAKLGAAASTIGTIVDAPLLQDPDNGDFRPTENATARPPAKAFVPWSLYAMVGEWNFIPNRDDPTLVLDEHWNMTEALIARGQYQHTPRYNLRGDWVAPESFVESPFESWGPSALRFSGKPLVLSDETVSGPVTVNLGDKKKTGEKTFPAGHLPTVEMGTNNFLLEVLFQPGKSKQGGLVSKMGKQAGYALVLNKAGQLEATLKASGSAATVNASLPDSPWVHVILEADRKNDALRLYVEGKLAATTRLGLDGSLENEVDFRVGDGFEGAMAFLRVSRGTLADAYTTIEELYAWQFEGPVLRDFTGKPRDFENGAAGAIER